MYLVTGAAGFIGSVFCKELNFAGVKEIIAVDQVDDLMNLKKVSYKAYYKSHEIFSEDFPWQRITRVFHLGACSSTTQMDIDFLRKNNVDYSKKIFFYCTRHNIPLIYASSAATYGAGEQGYSDCHKQVQKLKPLNPYGISKHLFDLWALEQKETPPLWIGLKFFNVYGPNEYHKGHMTSVVKKSFEQIQRVGKVALFKSYRKGYPHGGQMRDFVYVKDVARVMIRLSNIRDSKRSGLYNVGTGQCRSFSDLALAVFNALDRKPLIEFKEMPEKLKEQYQYYTKAQMEKLFSVLVDFRFLEIEDGVADYVNNHLVKEDPYY
jgi:ADP-L-glycero-D-manno-heptose 6-epimerase